jgi:hypothetical protein
MWLRGDDQAMAFSGWCRPTTACSGRRCAPPLMLSVRRHTPMLRQFISVPLACLAMVTACHSPARTTPVFTGCTHSDPVGPNSHLLLVRSTLPDSTLPDHQRGRLVASFQWSSDSLARTWPLRAARIRLTGVAVPFDTASSIRLPGDSTLLRATLLAPEGHYRFLIVAIGGVTLDTTVTIRAGFTDTAQVFLRLAGLTLCS